MRCSWMVNLYAMEMALSYIHDDLDYHSEHTLLGVRARNAEGYSHGVSSL